MTPATPRKPKGTGPQCCGGIPPKHIIGNAGVRRMAGGITRHTLIRWREKEGFPDPIRTLPGTPLTELWDAREVRAWLRERNQRSLQD